MVTSIFDPTPSIRYPSRGFSKKTKYTLHSPKLRLTSMDSTVSPSARTCVNCGHFHAQSQSLSSANCFFITIRRSGRDPVPLTTPHSLPTPSHPRERQQLRDYIWNEFENLKAEVDLDRDEIALKRGTKSKGALKEKAPLPWLSWSSPHGLRGQTRNKANFLAIWDRVMEEETRVQTGASKVWVSSILLPGRTDEIIWADETDRYEFFDSTAQELAEKMVLSEQQHDKWHRGPVVILS